MSQATTTSFPSLPSLYFRGWLNSKSAGDAVSSSTTTSQVDRNSHDNTLRALPAEVVHLCLVEYANWGDLAKLACVQRSFQDVVSDAAGMSQDAMWDLAQALLHGESGLQTNPTLAMRYLLQLSNMELDEETNIPIQKKSEHQSPFAPAMREIANCYLNGDGVEQESEKGMAWLKVSYADGLDNDAAFQCGHIYEHGKYGVTVDINAAFEWFEKAAEAGHVEAMTELALCYELGCGVEQNDEQALDWYMKAARMGHATAKYSVGEAFEEARGVPQSDEEACIWYYKAALDGDEDSRQALMRLRDIARIVVPGVGHLLDA